MGEKARITTAFLKVTTLHADTNPIQHLYQIQSNSTISDVQVAHYKFLYVIITQPTYIHIHKSMYISIFINAYLSINSMKLVLVGCWAST